MAFSNLGLYKVTVDPTDTAISLDEVKSHLKITATSENTYLTNLISVATEMVQNYTGQVLMESTMQLSLPYFVNRIDIQRVPVTEVIAVLYYDSNNSATTLSASNFISTLTMSSTDSPIATTIVATDDFSYPDTYPRMDAVVIQFKAGYTNAASVPMAIKQAMLLIIGQLYLNRTDMVYKMPVLSEYLLNPYRIATV